MDSKTMLFCRVFSLCILMNVLPTTKAFAEEKSPAPPRTEDIDDSLSIFNPKINLSAARFLFWTGKEFIFELQNDQKLLLQRSLDFDEKWLDFDIEMGSPLPASIAEFIRPYMHEAIGEKYAFMLFDSWELGTGDLSRFCLLSHGDGFDGFMGVLKTSNVSFTGKEMNIIPVGLIWSSKTKTSMDKVFFPTPLKKEEFPEGILEFIQNALGKKVMDILEVKKCRFNYKKVKGYMAVCKLEEQNKSVLVFLKEKDNKLSEILHISEDFGDFAKASSKALLLDEPEAEYCGPIRNAQFSILPDLDGNGWVEIVVRSMHLSYIGQFEGWTEDGSITNNITFDMVHDFYFGL